MPAGHAFWARPDACAMVNHKQGSDFLKQIQKSQISKEHIIQTAITEFGKYGFASASVNRICENGGISKGKLYHHFNGKSEIYLDAITYCYEMFALHMRQFHVDTAVSLEKNLLACYQLFSKFWYLHPEMLNLFVESRTFPPSELREEIMDTRSHFFNQAVKEKLREIVLFHFPNNEKQQKILVGLCFTAIDYITSSVASPAIHPQENLEGYIHAQNDLFQNAIHIFLYGCLQTNTQQN